MLHGEYFMKMTGKFTKSYENILEERASNSSLELIKSETDFTEIIKSESIPEMISKAQAMVPAIHKKMMLEPEGLPEQFKEKWLKTVDEARHSMEIVPQRRTLTEKTMAVLQSNRHPTASAKFHQANLEQATYAGMLIDLQFNYMEDKIKLEERFYKYQQKMKQLEDLKALEEDVFLLEKELQREQIALVKDAMGLAGTQTRMQNMREEIAEWSDLKQELYQEAQAAGEIWSPDAIDGSAGLQEIPLVLRHFQNFLIQVQQPEGSDISSVLNIQGLCLTAFQNGLKKQKLGLYVASLSIDQIKLLWKSLYGIDVEIERIPGFIMMKSNNFNYIFPETFAAWNDLHKPV